MLCYNVENVGRGEAEMTTHFAPLQVGVLLIDVPCQAEVGDLHHHVDADENVACRQVSVNQLHVAQVVHPVRRLPRERQQVLRKEQLARGCGGGTHVVRPGGGAVVAGTTVGWGGRHVGGPRVRVGDGCALVAVLAQEGAQRSV